MLQSPQDTTAEVHALYSPVLHNKQSHHNEMTKHHN